MKLFEEDTPEFELEVGLDGDTLEKIYDNLETTDPGNGRHLFDNENIPYLKNKGLIDEEGWPISTWESGDGTINKSKMTLAELYDMDPHFIESDYIKFLVLETYIKSCKNEEGTYTYLMTADDISHKNINEEFISNCFSGTAFDMFFGWQESSFNDVDSSTIELIDDRNKDILESMGLPRDSFELLYKDSYDDNELLNSCAEELKGAITDAYETAASYGAEYECLKDFDNAFRESLPEHCIWDEQNSDYENRPVLIKKEFVENNYEDIWEGFGYNSAQILNNVVDLFIEKFNEEFNRNFQEPYAGWYGFDEESFNEELYYKISDLKDYIVKKEEEDFKKEYPDSLLDFDGETNEYKK